ncbi:MAG: hydroxyacylglutathione hydrolase [Cellvibrionaceae bacterium]|jgi:hydroxyacylglutathione hydrolase
MIEIQQLPLGPMQTNCYILGCDETLKAAVIDPSWNGKAIAAALEEKNYKLDSILLTHAHFDHVGGLGELKELYPEVPIYIHAEAVAMLEMAEAQSKLFGMNFPATPPADRMLAAGDQIVVGNLILDVLFTPGHAPGHVSFHLASRQVIFSGDVLFQGSVGRTDLPGSNHTTLMKIIEEQLMVLPDETQVLSGHGPVTTIGQERLTNPFLQ